ncbi:RDD family protein [Rubrobacter taiwanensis]|jgi:uncharacterized RDD family membrane protein YckC|uniref:RDD family protein n=1 Tax=Rubrobacter taiwanensis TaxID=185139 RepID=A0A4R1BG51_9ACTN|nr:RDD family protein [Rubrobacter taiwanensis]TCJ16117.1 RDD family protein [Rubrobacter taiwanensis]
MTNQPFAVPPTSTAARDTNVLGQRVVATIIDAGIITVAIFVISFVLGIPAAIIGSDALLVLVNLLVFLLSFVIAFGYYIVLEGRSGQTIGKRICGIKVVDADTGQVPGMQAAVLRNVLRVVDGFMAYLVGFIVAITNDQHQRLGDKVARTLVVRA